MNKKRLMGFVCALLCVCFAGVCAFDLEMILTAKRMTYAQAKLKAQQAEEWF